MGLEVIREMGSIQCWHNVESAEVFGMPAANALILPVSDIELIVNPGFFLFLLGTTTGLKV
jgi:hypothetical protein